MQPSNALTDAKFVAEAHSDHIKVNPYYADEEGEMERLIKCGFDGILSNEPAILQNLLGRK